MVFFSLVVEIKNDSHHVCFSLFIYRISMSVSAVHGALEGGGGGVLMSHVDFKKPNVTLSNLRYAHVALLNLRNIHVPCHYLFYLMSHVTKA